MKISTIEVPVKCGIIALPFWERGNRNQGTGAAFSRPAASS
jgi:hypothetical protein